MSGGRGPAVGTAFHPETDSVFNGASRPASQPIALARLPRRRRPGMIALAVALVGAGILASTAVYSAANLRVPVLVAEASVPAGALIAASDVGTTSVSVGPGVQVIPASQLKQVVGQVAGTALHPGMLLTAAELATQRPPAPGQVLVPLPVRPSALPASGLQPGDHVLVVATPGAQGQSGSATAAPALSAPVAGVVEAVNTAANTDGFGVVDILVPARSGPDLAAQASTGQFALIVTRRSPS
ncbi:MAG TPA: SAF domain-containing protein [Streptosporangiaceae bacterium]|nr:SAF domain-containing protein [Streptosporangiaceae bacterium]